MSSQPTLKKYLLFLNHIIDMYNRTPTYNYLSRHKLMTLYVRTRKIIREKVVTKDF
ncbi:hypothetical protein NUSPORA_00358 [Nucleospora cyclopteri]